MRGKPYPAQAQQNAVLPEVPDFASLSPRRRTGTKLV
jgi:hypothetical protein